MIFLLTLSFGAFFYGRSLKQSRKENIFKFCQGYIESNKYLIAKFIPKQQRKGIQEYVANNAIEFNFLCQRTTNNISDLHYITKELFTQRESMIPYVLVLLEYAILKYINTEDSTTDELIDVLTVSLYKNSDFNPTQRYNNFICRLLFAFQLL